MVFFSKNIEIFEIQNFNKIASFTIFFFSIFGIFFYFTYPNLSKIMKFFVVF